MNFFKTKLMNRIAIGQVIGLSFGGFAFLFMPFVFNDPDILLRVAVLFWYISLGTIVGVFGIMDKHPIFNFSMSFLLRGILIGAWMNFVLALFIYEELLIIMQGSFFDGISPFFLVIEGMTFGLVVDYLATKFAGEGKKLLK